MLSTLCPPGPPRGGAHLEAVCERASACAEMGWGHVAEGRGSNTCGKRRDRHALLPMVTPDPLGSPPKILPEPTAPVFLKPVPPTWPGKLRGVMVFGVMGREGPDDPTSWQTNRREQETQLYLLTSLPGQSHRGCTSGTPADPPTLPQNLSPIRLAPAALASSMGTSGQPSL